MSTKERITKTSWPRNKVDSVQCRKRDLIVRIADWTKDKDEPAYDVEIYVKGVYDWNLSETVSLRNAGRTKREARLAACQFAQKRIAELL